MRFATSHVLQNLGECLSGLEHCHLNSTSSSSLTTEAVSRVLADLQIRATNLTSSQDLLAEVEGEGEVEVTWRVNLESLLVPLPFDKFLFSYPVFYFFI